MSSDSVIELTTGTVFFFHLRSFSHYSNKVLPNHVETIYIDDGPDAVDYKIVKLATPEDIVITQDYGLASLLLSKVKIVMHHKGHLYRSSNIDMLLQQRYNNAQIRKQAVVIRASPFQKKIKTI